MTVVDKPVLVPPPAACVALTTLAWDPEFDPFGRPGRDLINELIVRGEALLAAERQLECINDWVRAVSPR